MGDESKKSAESEPKLSWLIGLLVGLLLIWCFYGLAAYFLLPLFLTYHADIQKIGQFGDVFGALNALFSAFAFAVLIFTMILQRHELALQRNEIRGQKEQLEAQNRTMQRQVFESSFFSLLRAYQDIVNQIKHEQKEGRECFFKFANGLKEYVKKSADIAPGLTHCCYSEQVIRIADNSTYSQLIKDRTGPNRKLVLGCTEYFVTFQSTVEYYFRTIYHIYRFIDESDLDEKEKQRFARIVRAQLSTYELLLFFYNGLSPYGYEKFWPLANKYEIFQNLDVDLLFDPSHAKYYDGALGREIE